LLVCDTKPALVAALVDALEGLEPFVFAGKNRPPLIPYIRRFFPAGKALLMPRLHLRRWGEVRGPVGFAGSGGFFALRRFVFVLQCRHVGEAKAENKGNGGRFDAL